jgi:hypothetical protein
MNLNGLPWELISADLLINFNLTFADPRVEFKWFGTGKFILLLKVAINAFITKVCL